MVKVCYQPVHIDINFIREFSIIQRQMDKCFELASFHVNNLTKFGEFFFIIYVIDIKIPRRNVGKLIMRVLAKIKIPRF